jgi:hypothetical protein
VPSGRMQTLTLVAALLGTAGLLPSQPLVQVYPRGAKAPTQWTVAPRPSLEIGGSNGVGPAEFSGIVGLTRQADGTLIVADGTSRELRIFERDGRFRRAATRRGQGPGELPELDRLTAVGDTLVAIDGRRAVHVFAPDGRWLRSRTGELWVRTYVSEDGFRASVWPTNAVPSDWSIYDRQGRWVADCRLPARFSPVDVGADYVLGVSRDADDVERVSLWNLQR